MEVWRPQLHSYYSAKVCWSDFHVRAMSEYKDRGLGYEALGGCKQRNGLAERHVGLWPAEFPRFLFASLIEVPLVRVPQGKKLHKTGRVDTEVWNKLNTLPWKEHLRSIKLWWMDMLLWHWSRFARRLMPARQQRRSKSQLLTARCAFRVWRCVPPANDR